MSLINDLLAKEILVKQIYPFCRKKKPKQNNLLKIKHHETLISTGKGYRQPVAGFSSRDMQNITNHTSKKLVKQEKPYWICSYIVRSIGIVGLVVISVKKKQNKTNKIHFAFHRKKVE